jgi:hypothetical protein
MANFIFKQNSLSINGNPNLDGFIAEHHHANTFNLDATAKGSNYRAEVLESNLKDSADIVIKDGNGSVVKEVSLKYHATAKSTEGSLKGRYEDMDKVVDPEQAQSIEGAKSRVEYDGVQSQPLTKAEAKTIQEKTQQKDDAGNPNGEIKQYKWNDVSRGEIAKRIGKQALIGAGLVAGFHGVRVFGRRVWNNLLGKKNPPLSADLQDFFQSSVKSSAHVGIQVAVSGAIVVSARNGWLGAVLKNSPAGRLASMAYLGMENAKVLFKLAKGELTGMEAVDAMGKTTTSLAISMAAAGAGMVQGAALGVVFGPVGVFVGGLVGGIVGGMAGSKIGEHIYEGGKKIVKTAVDVVRSTVSAVSEGIKSVGRTLNPFNW